MGREFTWDGLAGRVDGYTEPVILDQDLFDEWMDGEAVCALRLGSELIPPDRWYPGQIFSVINYGEPRNHIPNLGFVPVEILEYGNLDVPKENPQYLPLLDVTRTCLAQGTEKIGPGSVRDLCTNESVIRELLGFEGEPTEANLKAYLKSRYKNRTGDWIDPVKTQFTILRLQVEQTIDDPRILPIVRTWFKLYQNLHLHT